jgi:hypothetical protein
VISKVLQDPSILPENAYTIDETGVMLSMLGSVKVLVGQDDIRRHRGSGVKQTMVTAIECISADAKSLHPLLPTEVTGPPIQHLASTTDSLRTGIITLRSA